MAKKLERTDAVGPPLGSSLAQLLRSSGVSVGGGTAQAPPSEAAPAAAPPLEFAGHSKIVLRRERKGHGGKTVTVIEGVNLSGDRLEDLARRLRRSLGSGARVDAGRIVVQGDQLGPLEAWLRARGAARVTRGN